MNKILFFLFFTSYVFSQESYQVKYTTAPIELDGVPDEAQWLNAPVMKGFQQYFPDDKSKANYDSEIKILFDEKNIYISGSMLSKGNEYIIPSFRRDFRAGGNDNITFVFDTFDDHTNGFMFGTNPYGVMREGLLFNGGTDNSFLNMFWDNKWKSAAKIYDGKWTCEIVIPLSTLRFKEGSQKWNFKCYRFDTQANETTALVGMPQNQIVMSLGFSTPIVFEKPLKKAGSNIAIIPYLLGSSIKNFEKPGSNDGLKAGFGFDAKVGVTSGLNLDLTYNPDFSNVQVDRQIVNLSRFDINLPEQRQFFLENSDLFTGYGSVITNPYLPPTGTAAIGNQLFTPFFSRSIGIAYDSVTKQNVQSKIDYGVRLSGKIDDNWRIGFMNTQTGKDTISKTNAQNYSVFSVQRKVFDRSNIAAIFVNKFAVGNENGSGSRFNRVGGLEYNLASKDNRWQGKAFYHKSFDAVAKDKAFAHGGVLNYTIKSFTAKWSHDVVGAGFNAESGFVPRKDYVHFNPTFGFNFFPKSTILNRYSFGLAYDSFQSKSLGLTDLKAGPFLLLGFQNTSRILMSFNQNYTYLFKNFDVLRSDNKLPSLQKGSNYRYKTWEANYVSDLRKVFSAVINPIIGTYYDGNIISFSGNLNYRFQPYAALTLNYSYNKINVSTGKNDVIVIGPNVDITLNKSIFWTSYVQYNSQFKNLNVNSRLQWRFAPVSDFFLVYTDNYNSEVWMPKNRAIFAKLTYWFSL